MSKHHSAAVLVDDVIRVAAHLEPELDEALAQHNLSRPSYQVLLALLAADGQSLTQRELMGSVGRTSGTLSVRLGRLERAGLVGRRPDPDDRRGVIVALTDRGRRRVEAARPDYAATAEALLAGLREGGRDELAADVAAWLGFFDPAQRDAPRLGVAVAPAAVARRMRRAVGLTDRRGVLIVRVGRDTAAARAGLARGDLVVAAAGADVRTIGDLHRAVASAAGELQLDVVRGADERSVAIDLAPGAG